MYLISDLYKCWWVQECGGIHCKESLKRTILALRKIKNFYTIFFTFLLNTEDKRVRVKLTFILCSVGRQWTYQTCTEFGYYQSTDSKSQVYGTTFPLR